jgi:hypothetical protein
MAEELSISIVKASLPGFSIPKVVTIGPSLKLGISYSWPAMAATLDVVHNSRSSRSGFSPIVNRKSEAYGDITATASLGLPVTLAFGLDFFDSTHCHSSVRLEADKITGKWSKDIDTKVVPSINSVAEFLLLGLPVPPERIYRSTRMGVEAFRGR